MPAQITSNVPAHALDQQERAVDAASPTRGRSVAHALTMSSQRQRARAASWTRRERWKWESEGLATGVKVPERCSLNK